MSRSPARRSLLVIVACTLAAMLGASSARAGEIGPTLRLDAGMMPAAIPVNLTTAVEATFTVTNDGPCEAFGVIVHEPFLTVLLANVDIVASASDPAITWIVLGIDPLVVSVPTLPAGESVTVRIRGEAFPECWMENLETEGVAFALNASEVFAPLTLGIDVDGPEVCDGADNDCDEEVDEGGDALCADADVCTGDETCAGTAGCVGGVPLTCDDHDQCTTDTCISGVGCIAMTIPDCPPCVPAAEACDDGLDTDCDGLADCADPDCAATAGCLPERTPENCDDCTDNDGDGLVDAEDPECCTGTAGLIVTRLRLEPQAALERKRLRLRVRDGGVLGTLDLAGRDVGLQFRDADGQLFCARVEPRYWKAARRRHEMSFHDPRHRYAAGLHYGRMRMRHNGMVQLDTRGGAMALRAPTGGQLAIRMRVGTQCFVAQRDLHAHHGVFRAP